MVDNKKEISIANALEPGTWNLEPEKRRPAVFLDRDGTIIDELGYLGDPEKMVIYPQAHEALKHLKRAGYLLIVVTNQSGIGRGYFSLEDAIAVNLRMVRHLSDGGAPVDAVYLCPHLPDAGCACRKPAPGMVQKAESDFNVDLEHSWMVGDTDKDILLGPEAGIKPLLLRTGKADKGIVPDNVPVMADLKQAARHILEAKSR